MAPAIVCASLNVCGLNALAVQLGLVDLLREQRVDVAMIQEHNVRDVSVLQGLSAEYHVVLNPPRTSFGGTLMLFSRRASISVLHTEMDEEGRVLFVRAEYLGVVIPFLTVYAPSGVAHRQDRELFFREGLLPFLRHDTRDLIFGGDFNCVTSVRDCSSAHPQNVSAALLAVLRACRFRDAAVLCGGSLEYTFAARGACSRLDRFYVSGGECSVFAFRTVPVAFSDHCLVVVRVGVRSQVRVGPGWWKLNCRLLHCPRVCAQFRAWWVGIVARKADFSSLFVWWEWCKVECRRFFGVVAKREAAGRFGLLRLLQARLSSLYVRLNAGVDCFGAISECKERICALRAVLADGVRVRARVAERVDGERLSPFLLGREKAARGSVLLNGLRRPDGSVLSGTEGVLIYARRELEALYGEVREDSVLAGSFLDRCSPGLSEAECARLVRDVSMGELLEVVRSFRSGRVPGADGLPVEFYLTFWDVVGEVLLEVVRASLRLGALPDSLCDGIVRLLPKPGDLQLFSNWRPITLLNVDYKILSKVLARRCRSVVASVISMEQFCGVPGRALVHCNALFRDVLLYASEYRLSAAMISLDWSKAFDRVSLAFVFSAMERLGFPAVFVDWVRLLYVRSRSRVCVNGFFSSFFPIRRSVRQGCPMSMLLYVIFQEPLFRAVKACSLIVPPLLPSGLRLPICGYADDTVLFVASVDSVGAVQDILLQFESATGAVLNRAKSGLMGIGVWASRLVWEGSWFPVVSSIRVLGVTWFASYDHSLEWNWSAVSQSVGVAVGLLSNRPLTVYQRGLLVACKVLSRVWFVARCFPLDRRKATGLESMVYRYVWCGRYQPVRRSTLVLGVSEGGVGIPDVFTKAKALFWVSLRQGLVLGGGLNALGVFFCSLRFSYLVDLGVCQEVALYTPPVYSWAVGILRELCRHPGFMSFSCKAVYEVLLPRVRPRVEGLFPCWDWGGIWSCLGGRFLAPQQRELLFRFLHLSLATNERLCMLGLRDSAACVHCGFSESQVHVFYFCVRLQGLVAWFRDVLEVFCGPDCRGGVLQFLFLSFPGYSRRVRNTLCVLIADYVFCVWVGRREGYGVTRVLGFLRGRMRFTWWWLQRAFPVEFGRWFTVAYVRGIAFGSVGASVVG